MMRNILIVYGSLPLYMGNRGRVTICLLITKSLQKYDDNWSVGEQAHQQEWDTVFIIVMHAHDSLCFSSIMS